MPHLAANSFSSWGRSHRTSLKESGLEGPGPGVAKTDGCVWIISLAALTTWNSFIAAKPEHCDWPQSQAGWVPAISQVFHCDIVLRPPPVLEKIGDWLPHQQLLQWCAKFSDSILACIGDFRWWYLREIGRCRHPWWGWVGSNFLTCVNKSSWAKMAVPFWLWMFAHIILASASTASSQMSAKHQENDTPVKASHLLLVDCGVSSSGSRTLSVGGAPQAREICVVPPEQCGVVTLCDLPTAEGQGSPLPIPWLVQWLIIPVWMRQVFSDRPARL